MKCDLPFKDVGTWRPQLRLRGKVRETELVRNFPTIESHHPFANRGRT